MAETINNGLTIILFNLSDQHFQCCLRIGLRGGNLQRFIRKIYRQPSVRFSIR